MKLLDYITGSTRPVGDLKMLSARKIYACELGPEWQSIKKDIIESTSDISIELFKIYWEDRYKNSEIDYPNILWADQHDFVMRNVHQDEIGEHFIKLQHGWAPVVSSLKLGSLVCFMYPKSQPSVAEECGLVYIYPWAKGYGKRI